MRTLLFLLGILLIAPISAHAADWQLIWSDEFDYEGLPDKTKWDYEDGFVRNDEKQYYTRDRLENARVEGGFLTIECRKEHYTPEGQPPVEYTSASINTQGKASWRYGRIEVRAKLPRGKGIWPAVWMLGTNFPQIGWPACGEIDIMEYVGKEPNNVYGTLHYGLTDNQDHYDTGKIETPKPYEDFHIYAIEWYSDRIDFFFDRQKYYTVRVSRAGRGADNPFRKPYYLLLNLALGGSWGGPIIDESVLPQKYVVDYVRVYREGPGLKDAPKSAPEK